MPIIHATPIKDHTVWIEYRKAGVTQVMKQRIEAIYSDVMEVTAIDDYTITVRVNSWAAIEYLRICANRAEGQVLTKEDY